MVDVKLMLGKVLKVSHRYLPPCFSYRENSAGEGVESAPTPAGSVLTFGKNAGYPYPPPPRRRHPCVYLLQTWTPFSSPEFSRIFLKNHRVPVSKSFTHIPDFCLSFHQNRLVHQVRSTDHASRKVRYCVMATVLWDYHETCDGYIHTYIWIVKLKIRK